MVEVPPIAFFSMITKVAILRGRARGTLGPAEVLSARPIGSGTVSARGVQCWGGLASIEGRGISCGGWVGGLLAARFARKK